MATAAEIANALRQLKAKHDDALARQIVDWIRDHPREATLALREVVPLDATKVPPVRIRASAAARKSWRNVIGNQTVTPTTLAKPTSLADLIAIVKEAGDVRKVRAAGTGHSFSDVMITNDILIDITGLTGIPPVDPSRTLKPRGPSDPPLFTVEAGVTVDAANQALDAQGLALVNMGAYTGQTLIGAISTGTHGTGVGLGNLASSVVSLVLVTSHGAVKQIEPANGITDPVLFKAAHANDGWTLIQDDDTFQSVVVSMGCMGILFSVTLAVTPAYYLHEERTLDTWENQRADPQALRARIGQYRHFEIDVNPYSIDGSTNGKHNCIVTCRDIVQATTPSGWRGFDNWLDGILASYPIVETALVTLVNFLPNLAPFFIDSALQSLEDSGYIDKSFRVLDLGAANDLSAYATEIAFPLDPIENVIAAVDAILTQAQANLAKGVAQTGPVALRFVAASNGYLTPEHQGPTCRMELDMLNGTNDGFDTLDGYQKTTRRFGGIPHWGLELDQLTGADNTLAKMYPRYPAWLAVFERMNPCGTFTGPFTQRMQLPASGDAQRALKGGSDHE